MPLKSRFRAKVHWQGGRQQSGTGPAAYRVNQSGNSQSGVAGPHDGRGFAKATRR